MNRAVTNAWFVIFDLTWALLNVAFGVMNFAHHNWLCVISFAATAFLLYAAETQRRRAYKCLEPNRTWKLLRQSPPSGSLLAQEESPAKSPYRLRWLPWPHLSPNPKRSPLNLKAPVIGYRSWAEPDLTSWNGWSWQPGINKATCRMKLWIFGHTAPARWCGCGFNATHGLLYAGHVTGIVQCWGRIYRHGDVGFRAEYARVIALIREYSFTGRAHPELDRIAAKFGVPIISALDAEAFARDYGISLAP